TLDRRPCLVLAAEMKERVRQLKRPQPRLKVGRRSFEDLGRPRIVAAVEGDDPFPELRQRVRRIQTDGFVDLPLRLVEHTDVEEDESELMVRLVAVRIARVAAGD